MVSKAISLFFTISFSVIWGGLLWVLVIGKVSTDTFQSFIEHFTNWNLTISAIFFLADIISYMDKTKIVLKFVLAILFWFANGTAWLVFWLVFILFADNSDELTKLSKGEGGPFSMGFLLNMNAIVHYIPAIAMLIYVILNILLRDYTIVQSVREEVGPDKPFFYKIVYIGVIVFFPLYFSAAYQAYIPFRQVYGISTPNIIIIFVSIIIVIIFNFIPLIAFYNVNLNRIEYKKEKWI